MLINKILDISQNIYCKAAVWHVIPIHVHNKMFMNYTRLNTSYIIIKTYLLLHQ